MQRYYSWTAPQNKARRNRKLHTGGCPICRKLRLRNPKGINTTYTMLQSTADKCELCDIVKQVCEIISESTTHAARDSATVYVDPPDKKEDKPLATVTMHWVLGENSKTTLFSEMKLVHILQGDTCPWSLLASEKQPEDDPSIRDCAQFLKAALQECMTEHTECTAYQLARSLMTLSAQKVAPRRLLDISNRSAAERPRLCDLESPIPTYDINNIQYAALSHCWGSSQVTRTTTATLPKFLEDGIEWSDMPKTFQEAILVARELGIDYIWIDSLCIVQDSLSDWSDQAAQMGDIFSNAYLTIAASAAENGQQGLFNRHKIRRFGKRQGSEDYTVYVRDSIPHELRDSPRPFPWENHLTLRRRAWCLQEELLSTRIVHFTKNEMVFVCRERTKCECTPCWLPRFRLPPIVGSTQKSLSEVWSDVVEHYSQRQISFPKDRLPALSSLSDFFDSHSDKYLAGLWQSHMPISLLWWTDGRCHAESYFLSHSNPPSWSWASIEGIVYSPRRMILSLEIDTVANVVDGHTYPSTNDPRGMVFEGHITVQAPLLRLEGAWNKKDDNDAFSAFGTPWIIQNPGWRPRSQMPEGIPCHCAPDDVRKVSLSPTAFSDTPTFLLVICNWVDGLKTWAHGILLREVEHLSKIQRGVMETTEGERAFVRVGVGKIALYPEEFSTAQDLSDHATVTIF